LNAHAPRAGAKIELRTGRRGDAKRRDRNKNAQEFGHGILLCWNADFGQRFG
jgi:hypothetical protein